MDRVKAMEVLEKGINTHSNGTLSGARTTESDRKDGIFGSVHGECRRGGKECTFVDSSRGDYLVFEQEAQ